MVKNHNLTARSFGSLIGRDQFIIDVLDALKDNFSLVSIEGYSGIGKTSLAKEVAYRCIEANRNEVEVPPCFDYIVWIDTPKNPTSTWINEIFDQIATVTGHLSIKGTLRDRNEKKNDILEILRKNRVLIIIDNFTYVKEVIDWANSIFDQSKVLVTCQVRIPCNRIIQLKDFSVREALLFIKQVSKNILLDSINSQTERLLKTNHIPSELKDIPEDEPDELLYFLRLLYGNPKALDLALGYINQSNLTLTELITILKEKNERRTRPTFLSELHKLSWECLNSNEKAILFAFTFFPRNSLVRPEALQKTSGLESHHFEKGCISLINWKLIEKNDRRRLTVHPITLDFAQIQFGKKDEIRSKFRERWLNYNLEFLRSSIIRELPAVPYWNALVSDGMINVDEEWQTIQEVLKFVFESDRNELKVELMNLVVHYLDSRLLNELRVDFGLKATAAANHLGSRFQEALFLIDTLGWTYIEENKFSDATNAIQAGLNIIEGLLDKEKNTLQALANNWLARVALEQNDLGKALEFYTKINIEGVEPWIEYRIIMMSGDINLKSRKSDVALQNYLKAKEITKDYKTEGNFYQIDPRIGLAYVARYDECGDPNDLLNADKIFRSLHQESDAITIGKFYARYGLALVDLKQNSDTGYERLEDVKADLLKKSPSNLLIQLIEAVQAGIPPPSTALNNEKKTQVDHPAGDSSPVNDAGRPDQLKIFISYAHNDQDYFDVFFPELSSNCREPVIWVDRKIPVGSDWFSEIQNAIDTSAMAILLVSPSFLGSNFIMEHEWKRLTAVRNSNPKFALVPILFRDVNISRIEHLNGIQFFNASGEKYQVFSHKGQLLPFAQLCEFGKNGVLPNPNRDTYFKYLMEVIYKNLGHAISRGAP